MHFRKLRLLWPILLFLLGFPALHPASAQTSQSDIGGRLLHHPLFLRGSWGDDKLSFDASGTPLKPYKTVPFTVAAIDISKVTLDGDVLALEGARVGVIFEAPDAMRFVALGRERIRIEVHGRSGQDFGPALDAIFAKDLKDVPSACTGAWKSYAEKHWPSQLPAKDPAAETGSDHGTRLEVKPAGNVKPPRALKVVDPEFSEAARARKYSAVVTVRFSVGPDGLPSDIQITRPAGLALDEQALAAVQKYRFAPATRDGTPIAVELYVDVDFKIF